MSWVQRGNYSYYERNARINGKRTKVYFGRGEAAQSAYQEDIQRRSQREAQKAAQQRRQEHQNAVVATVNTFGTNTDLLVKANLLAIGYHQHDRGAWRKKRDGSQQPTD